METLSEAPSEPQPTGGSTESRVRHSGARASRLVRVSTVAAVADDLAKRVLDGELVPGRQLREVELAQDYAVARHTIRSALQTLVHGGVLSHLPNRGAFVPVLTPGDLQDVFRLRTAIEIQAVTELAADRFVSSELAAAFDALGVLSPLARWSELIEAELRFHRALVDSIGSPRLADAYSHLQRQLQLALAQLRKHWKPSKAVTAHRAILDTIRTGDPDRAASEMRAHLGASRRSLEEALSC